MRSNQIYVDNILAQKLLLEKMKVPYKLKFSGQSKYIYCTMDGEPIIFKDSENEFTNRELQFIKKVRNEIIERCEKWESDNFAKLPAYDSLYIRCAPGMPHSVADCIEIDLNAAYWHYAEDMGYISKETYKEGIDILPDGNLKYRKKVRLAALGSIAKLDRYIKWDGKGFDQHNYTLWHERHEYAKVFFNISRYVYDAMCVCMNMLGEDFLFFWVDAVFFRNRPGNIEMIMDIIKEMGLTAKQYNISKFTFDQTESKIIVTSPNHKESERVFNLSKDDEW